MSFLLFLNIITVLIGDEKSSLTVVNGTEYYIHFFVEGTEYLYVKPGRSFTHESDPKPDMIVTALYSPGQEIQGSVTDTVSIPYRGSSSGCTCEQDGGSDCAYTPPSGGSTSWEVTPDMIEAEFID